MPEASSGGAAFATLDRVTNDIIDVNKPACAKIGDGHQPGANESMSGLVGDS